LEKVSNYLAVSIEIHWYLVVKLILVLSKHDDHFILKESLLFNNILYTFIKLNFFITLLYMSTYTPEAFILKNQLVVTDTTDATNGTSGAFVITGGASVSKTLIVSGDQSVAGQASINNVNITPNANDIIYEKQAVLSSDVSSFTDISGFYFLDTVASAFKAYITVIVTGPTNKYAFWELNSVYTPTGWAYTSSFTGDITGVNFNIDVTGSTAKVQYTNSNGAGYSTVIRYRAQTTAPAGSSPTGGTGLFNSTTNNYVTNTLLYANSSDTVASAGDITFSNNVLNVGGATKLQVSKTTDAANLSSAALVVDGGASISKRLLVGTRVGINNTNPSYNLDIGGDININGNIYQNGSIYSGSSLWAGNSLQNYYINPTGSFVGIGTTNPSTNLEVSGGLKATSATVSSLMASGANVTNLSVTNITLGSITPTSISTGSLSTPAVVSTNATLGSLNVDNFEFKNMTIASSLIPNANVTYDLGSSSRRWRDLYLSGNTIHLGDSVMISASTTGSISITSAGDGVFTAAIISTGSLYTNAITSGSLTASDISSISENELSNIVSELTSYFEARKIRMSGYNNLISNLLKQENFDQIKRWIEEAFKEWKKESNRNLTDNKTFVFNNKSARSTPPQEQLYVDIEEYEGNIHSKKWQVPMSLRVIEPEAAIKINSI
jgi:hypothetical protein